MPARLVNMHKRDLLLNDQGPKATYSQRDCDNNVICAGDMQ